MASIAAAAALRRAAASLHASAALRGPAQLHGAAPPHGLAQLHGAAPPHGPAQLHGAAPPHGPGPHLPGPFRFGRPRHCIRGDSGPPTPDEEESERLKKKIESMDKEELLQYVKQVTRDYEKLRLKPQCNFDQAGMNTLKRDVEETKARVGKIQTSIDKRKDVTSVYIPGFGSVNLLAFGMFFWQVIEKM